MMSKKKSEQLARDLAKANRSSGMLADTLSRLIRNKAGMIGIIIILMLFILCLAAPVFTHWDPYAQSVKDRLLLPSSEHIFGTDDFGRDIWSRMLYGGRYSLFIAVGAMLISTFVGMILGAVAGFFGGKTDLIIMRILDIIQSIPGLLLAIAISSALGSGPFNTMLAISTAGIAGTGRIMRSTVMTIRGDEFVEAARATGSSNFRIIMKEVVPNTIAPLIINASLSIGGNIMAISGLSFIGLGVQGSTPEWGAILAVGKTYLREFWPLVVFPAIALTLTIFGFNLLGDALRDALDPRLKD